MSRKAGPLAFTLSRCGILSALSVLLYQLELPVVAFYRLDLSTLPAILAGFAMGPGPAAAIVLVKNLAHLPVTGTAGIGELADTLVSCAYVLTASLLYRRSRTRRGALAAMAAGMAAMTVSGVLVNYFLLIPAYQAVMGLTAEAIIGMGQTACSAVNSLPALMLYITAPFNLLKGAALSAAAWLLYKRASPLLHSHPGRRA